MASGSETLTHGAESRGRTQHSRQGGCLSGCARGSGRPLLVSCERPLSIGPPGPQQIALGLLGHLQGFELLRVDMLLDDLAHQIAQQVGADGVELDGITTLPSHAAAIARLDRTGRQIPYRYLLGSHGDLLGMDLSAGSKLLQPALDVVSRILPARVPVTQMVDLGRFFPRLDVFGRTIGAYCSGFSAEQDKTSPR